MPSHIIPNKNFYTKNISFKKDVIWRPIEKDFFLTELVLVNPSEYTLITTIWFNLGGTERKEISLFNAEPNSTLYISSDILFNHHPDWMKGDHISAQLFNENIPAYVTPEIYLRLVGREAETLKEIVA